MNLALVTQDIVNASQEDQGNVVLATERTHNNSNKMERFSYIDEWANAW